MKKHGGDQRDKMEIICTRVEPDLLERIKTFTDQLKRERPGVHVKRSDAMRVLITIGLEAQAQGKIR